MNYTFYQPVRLFTTSEQAQTCGSYLLDIVTCVARAGVAMFFKIAEVSERNACSLKIDFLNRRGAGCPHIRTRYLKVFLRRHARPFLGLDMAGSSMWLSCATRVHNPSPVSNK